MSAAKDRKHQIWHGDCHELLEELEDGSVDLFFIDIPWVETQNDWDVGLNLRQVIRTMKKKLKLKGVILFWGSFKLSADVYALIKSIFRYERIHVIDNKHSGNLNAKTRPLKNHIIELVCGKKTGVYNAQKTTGEYRAPATVGNPSQSSNYAKQVPYVTEGGNQKHPKAVIHHTVDHQQFLKPKVNGKRPKGQLHDTQKPLEPIRNALKTHSVEGMLVVDFCCGSGGVLVESQKLNRDCIVMDIELEHCKTTSQRTGVPVTMGKGRYGRGKERLMTMEDFALEEVA